jgi:hypothetical protein
MSLLLKDTVHSALSESIFNDIFTRRSNYYYFIGKVLEWADQNVPDTPEATYYYEYETRNNIIGFKKINVSDASYVVERINWSSGQVYDQYDPDYSTTNLSSTGASSIKTAQFYVLSSDFNVYKCIFNKNGSASTSSPSGTDALPITTADGYVWKFLYTIPLSSRNKFLTADFMPVQKNVQNAFYSKGEIDRVTIDSNGSGYLGNAEVSLTVQGTFKSGAGNSIANLRPVFNAAGKFIDVIIVDRGNNYSNANVVITDIASTGTGYYNTAGKAIIVPLLYQSQVDSVAIIDPGVNYSSNIQTYISIIGDGTGAELTPFINTAGQLEDVIITSRGQGYTYADIEVVGDGTGANAFVDLSYGDLDTSQSTVELSAIPGSIYNIKIQSGGTNYSNANVTVSGDGVNFSGIVNLSNTNTVSSITITNPGQDFTFANVVITGSGSGATANAILSPFGGHGSNPVKELFADSVMLFSTINNEKNQGISVNNDYRQIGIIKDPKQYGNSKAFANTSGSSCFLVTLNSVASISADDQLELSGDPTKLFEVVEVVSSSNQILVLSKNNYTLTTSSSFYKRSIDTTFTISAVNAVPTINKFSGDMIFIDNRTKISYSDQQLISIRTVIKL